MSCVYLGEPTGRNKGRQKAFECDFLECHVVEGVGSRAVPGCSTCKHKLAASDAGFLKKWRDPLLVTDRRQKRTDAVRGMLAGRSVFLACSGPSANDLPLEELDRRGVWTFAVNNMAGHGRFRADAFVCSDPPVKFSHSIWLDPAVMKWVPTPKMKGNRAKLKKKTGPGKFEPLKETVTDCPNVWGFRRNPWLTPDDRFFLSNGAAWGNQDAGVRRTGEKKTVNTMFLAMRILRYLGAGRVFMIGVDFWMDANHGYAFDQSIQHKNHDVWDNRQYAVTNEWLCKMQRDGVFERFGIEFYNCFEHSMLRAFPFVPFDRAVRECKGIVEDVPSLSGWYDLAKNG